MLVASFSGLYCSAAVSCSPDVYRLGGVGFRFCLTGKLGRAWHWCMGGAWVGARCWLGGRGRGII